MHLAGTNGAGFKQQEKMESPMSELIRQLTLGAGLNSERKILRYLEISRSTWFRRVRAGKLRRVEWEALRHRAGYLLHGKFRDYRILEDRIIHAMPDSRPRVRLKTWI